MNAYSSGEREHSAKKGRACQDSCDRKGAWREVLAQPTAIGSGLDFSLCLMRRHRLKSMPLAALEAACLTLAHSRAYKHE